jgi:hypothetical protein
MSTSTICDWKTVRSVHPREKPDIMSIRVEVDRPTFDHEIVRPRRNVSEERELRVYLPSLFSRNPSLSSTT